MSNRNNFQPLVFKNPRSQSSQLKTPICPYPDSSGPSTPIPHDFKNTTDYYEPSKEIVSPNRSISSRLKKKNKMVKILKE
jgi:hypothetical protein